MATVPYLHLVRSDRRYNILSYNVISVLPFMNNGVRFNIYPLRSFNEDPTPIYANWGRASTRVSVFYKQVIQVPRYVIFRPDTGRIEVYTLLAGHYQLQTPDAADRYWIPGLDLSLGVWEGTHEGRTGYWLRWWNAQEELLLWSEERAEQERQRADRLAERLRQLGENPV